jgi:hypothetical protein
MSCYRVLRREGLIQRKRIGQDRRQAAARCDQMRRPRSSTRCCTEIFTDYVTEDGEKSPRRTWCRLRPITLPEI